MIEMPPFHEELHKILTEKGWMYERIDGEDDILSADFYMDRKGRTIVFFEDESITALNIHGMDMTDSQFDEITDNIFDPDRSHH
jgi:hypothetical protein